MHSTSPSSFVKFDLVVFSNLAERKSDKRKNPLQPIRSQHNVKEKWFRTPSYWIVLYLCPYNLSWKFGEIQPGTFCDILLTDVTWGSRQLGGGIFNNKEDTWREQQSRGLSGPLQVSLQLVQGEKICTKICLCPVSQEELISYIKLFQLQFLIFVSSTFKELIYFSLVIHASLPADWWSLLIVSHGHTAQVLAWRYPWNGLLPCAAGGQSTTTLTHSSCPSLFTLAVNYPSVFIQMQPLKFAVVSSNWLRS